MDTEDKTLMRFRGGKADVTLPLTDENIEILKRILDTVKSHSEELSQNQKV